MAFKEYPKTWESVFTNEYMMNRFDPARCTIEGFSLQDYTDLFSRTLQSISEENFNFLVKFIWLMRKFRYKGKRKRYYTRNSSYVNNAFATYTRNYMGYYYANFTGRSVERVISYFNDFFPYFDRYDPFKNPEKFKYPYKHITTDFLALAAYMDDRLEILDKAEREKMKYGYFCDYLINHALSVNEESKKPVYDFKIVDKRQISITKVKKI